MGGAEGVPGRGAALSIGETLRRAHGALEAAGVGHALIGALAMAALGVPRATADVDLLLDGERRAEARAALIAAGFAVFFESEDVIQFSGPGDLDCLMARRPLARAMLETAWEVPRLGLRCVSAEDVIGLKIQAYVNDRSRELREKADIAALAHVRPGLDWAKVREYAELFGEWNEIEALRGKS